MTGAGWQRVFRLIPLLLIFAGAPPSVGAAADYRIVTGDLPPWSIHGGTGIFTDLVFEIEKRIGGRHRPDLLPWSRAQANAKNSDNYLIYPIARTERREEKYRWIVDVMPLIMVFATIGGEPVDLTAARGLGSILVHQDAPPYTFLYGEGFRNLHKLPQGAGSIPMMLGRGRADAWFSDIGLMRYSVRGTPLAGKIVFGPPVMTSRLYIAGSRNLAEKIVGAYRRAFAEIMADGTLHRIRVKYLGP